MRDSTTILLEEAYDKVRLLEVVLTNANVEKFNKRYGTGFAFEPHILKSIFDRFNKVQPRLAIKDIFGYNSLQDLQRAIYAQSNKENEKSVKSEQANIIINNDRLLLVEPLTVEASILYGANTKWCTAARTDNKFLNYLIEGYKDTACLLYLIDKKLNTKYGIVYRWDTKPFFEVRNEEDVRVPAKSFLSTYKDIDWIYVRAHVVPWEIKYRKYLTGRVEDKTSEVWYVNGKWSREDGPARIERYPNGNIKLEAWYKNGEEHRDNGPAETRYYPNGNKMIEAWYKNGEEHRDNGPAITTYYLNNKPQTMKWYENGNEIAQKSFNNNGEEIVSQKSANILPQELKDKIWSNKLYSSTREL